MTLDDMPTFSALLGELFATLAPDKDRPDAARTMTWFRVLEPYPMKLVIAGVDGHMRRPLTGRTLPIPSDIVAQVGLLLANDGRPEPDEAWALALTGRDESETIVWTAEIAQAWGVAKPVLARRDETGARMAFREAYNRLVTQARQDGKPVDWQVALGHDSTRHADALKRAADLGRISHETASQLAVLLAPRGPLLLLADGSGRSGAPTPEQLRVLEAVRAALANRPEAESADALARARTEDLKRQATDLVGGYLASSPEAP